jgi:hypothetical protein
LCGAALLREMLLLRADVPGFPLFPFPLRLFHAGVEDLPDEEPCVEWPFPLPCDPFSDAAEACDPLPFALLAAPPFQRLLAAGRAALAGRAVAERASCGRRAERLLAEFCAVFRSRVCGVGRLR